MDLNFLVFPAPQSEYKDDHKTLYWLPKETKTLFSSIKLSYIPFIFSESQDPKNQNLILFFHGNAEDITHSEQTISNIALNLNAHFAILEYPGYGLYTDSSPSEKLICEDSALLYEFFTKKVGFKAENIIIIGRSMGSGPAVFLTSQYKVKCLALISPFKSIKSVAKEVSAFGFLLSERFNNLKRIKSINQPVFILHGEKVP